MRSITTTAQSACCEYHLRGNQASTGGGALANSGGTVTIVDSVLWGDKVGEQADEVYTSGGTVTVTNSDVEGDYPGNANIASDPLFVDAAGGIFTLQPSSPCIDKGSAAEHSEYDLDHMERVLDGDGDGNPVVDMGAYEFQETP